MQAVWAGWGALCWLRRKGVGTENLAHRQGRHSIFSGPPRGIGHLVSETFSGGDRASGDEGERDGGCTPQGDWEVMVGGDTTWRPLWPSEDPRGSAVHSGTVSYPLPSSQGCSGPRPLVEVEQRREQFCQEGGETGGKTGVARGDFRLPSPVQHNVPRKSIEQSSV